MNCQNAKEGLLEYQCGQLSQDLRQQVAEHLSSCSSCRLQFQQLQQVEAELNRLGEIEPSPYFDQKLNAKLDELAKPRATWHDRLSFWLRDRYALTFVLLLLTTLGAWIGFRHQQAQRLKSIKEVLQVQERYLGSPDVPATKMSPTRAEEPTRSTQVGADAGSLEDETIPEADRAVLENYELLEDYDFLKNFDIADPRNQDLETGNSN